MRRRAPGFIPVRMARIPGVPARQAGLLTRFVYRMARKRVGQVPEPLAVAANHGSVFRAYVGYEYWLEKARRVDARLKCLASLCAARQIGCPF